MNALGIFLLLWDVLLTAVMKTRVVLLIYHNISTLHLLSCHCLGFGTHKTKAARSQPQHSKNAQQRAATFPGPPAAWHHWLQEQLAAVRLNDIQHPSDCAQTNGAYCII